MISSRSICDDSDDPESWDVRGPIFLADLHTYTRIVLPRTTEFGMVIRGERVDVQVSRPSFQGGGIQCNKTFLGRPTYIPRFNIERPNSAL